jgi:hypothetical protein
MKRYVATIYFESNVENVNWEKKIADMLNYSTHGYVPEITDIHVEEVEDEQIESK